METSAALGKMSFHMGTLTEMASLLQFLVVKLRIHALDITRSNLVSYETIVSRKYPGKDMLDEKGMHSILNILIGGYWSSRGKTYSRKPLC